ncbi:hypothetical protein B0T10DRAFT_604662 [Thelonectria olida]|uniref:Uncharacterized protein n=1 Tax=Thelonectria olida TaxID=1576542 RepID=A0A9P8W9U6_9HYPO|nr:hypothetical protein B0T10DRAFT_604662 [Thelonectria olida]
MSNTQGENCRIPTFITSNEVASPFFYFRHIVDPDDATLKVQAIGPDLEFTFTHSRAKAMFSRSKIKFQLEQKTAGFVALVTNTGHRVVLSAAESGHGAGRLGDVLDAPPGVLANALWTRRAVAVGKLLGINMRRPFDNPHGFIAGADGIFQGSHVEVKLAVHGIFLLLNTFNITRNFDNVRLGHLKRLKNALWEDGTRPSLEVYFSRKNCACCGQLVRALAGVTGISIRLLWKHRLELKEYASKPLGAADGSGRARGGQEAEVLVEGQDMDFGDGLSRDFDSDNEALDGEDSDDDVQALDLVDLVSNAPISISPGPQEVISVSPAAEEGQGPEPHPADDYLDGLAYRVGQLESSPEGAAEAVVQFATKMVGTNKISWLPSNSPPGLDTPNINNPSSSAASTVAKPLPATPKTEPPEWMLGGGKAKKPSRLRREDSESEDDDWEFPERRKGMSSPCERALKRESKVRDRSPRRYSARPLERTVVKRTISRICVEIPVKRRSTSSEVSYVM